MSKDKMYEVDEQVKEIKKSKKPLRGITTKEFLLNVRKEPNIESEVIHSLTYSSGVMIDEENSTDEWYKIRVKNGVEGYCMKQYIFVKH